MQVASRFHRIDARHSTSQLPPSPGNRHGMGLTTSTSLGSPKMPRLPIKNLQKSLPILDLPLQSLDGTILHISVPHALHILQKRVKL
ncbi:hypothetical protein KC19_10G063500 [Ceratodon purpureus]|uniref:Uncharacterized protein n=1 Tax=Ceratodon purpureus TaxID=3225 RepID=A0A8T0GIR2_CERPU|nr:hypothetical protein KC19_10G063500 [Ceratodon purpureus]